MKGVPSQKLYETLKCSPEGGGRKFTTGTLVGKSLFEVSVKFPGQSATLEKSQTKRLTPKTS